MKDDPHAIVMYGTRRLNWSNRHQLDEGKEHVTTDGTTYPVLRSKAPGIHFGCMVGDASGEVVVFRVGDVTLDNDFTVDWDRYGWPAGDRCISTNGKRIPDSLASRFLDDAIAQNPNQANEVDGYRRRIHS